MKKLVTILVLLLASFASFSQQENSFNNLTSGKWQIQSVEIENEVMSVSNEDSWMVFYENGLYEMYLDEESQVGTWNLNENNVLNFDVENFDGESNIRKLTDHDLKFSISGYTLALSKS